MQGGRKVVLQSRVLFENVKISYNQPVVTPMCIVYEQCFITAVITGLCQMLFDTMLMV